MKYKIIDNNTCSHGHDHTPQKDETDEHCYYKGGPLSHELFSHLPFSVLSVTVGIIFAGLICFMTPDSIMERASIAVEQAHAGHDHGSAATSHGDHSGHEHGDHAGHANTEADAKNDAPSSLGFLFLFHLFHPAHILFSAIATTAMFYRYDKNILKAAIIGFTGSIIICTVSDALIPTLTAKLMGFDAPFHICITETPGQIITFAAIGVLLGIIAVFSGTLKSTIASHSVHVASSTMATLFYVVAFSGRLEWINQIGLVFLMTCVAVGGICCISDVVFPLLFTKKAREEYALNGHDHPH